MEQLAQPEMLRAFGINQTEPSGDFTLYEAAGEIGSTDSLEQVVHFLLDLVGDGAPSSGKLLH